MKPVYKICLMALLPVAACKTPDKKEAAAIRLITLDPGHFHAALVQKTMLPDIDSTVYVYAPGGAELEQHLAKINTYNTAPQSPTHWHEEVYKGSDFLDKMIADKKGNVVVIAGNNANKTSYIRKSIEAGFNVLADKPMAIDQPNFEMLEKAFATAAEKKLLLYDIMTERFEITNKLQRELAMLPGLFGTLLQGTSAEPAVTMESVHYFYKTVSGSVLTRPAWFMDVSQQGEGMVDVATHLVDLVQWACFPDKRIDYHKDIQVNAAKRWSTDMLLSQFTAVTKETSFPAWLKKNVVKDSVLQVYANGEINYNINGVYVKVIARWDYKAPEGAGDTHYALLRGTKATLLIKQGIAEKYKPTLYIIPTAGKDALTAEELATQFAGIKTKYPGVSFEKATNGYLVTIPDSYKDGHEAHFAMVANTFLGYMKQKNMPEWEIPNMLAKYYTTTQALKLTKKQ